MEEVKMEKGRKIVVAVDESKESMLALSWCLSNLISPDSNTNLVLLYVKPPPPLYSAYDAAGYLFSGDVISAVEKYSKDLVSSVMERAEAVYKNSINNIQVERLVGSGDAKDVICSTVEKLRADTLVMGSHGYGFFKRTLLGSVSEYCAKHVKCPVVIVKHTGEKCSFNNMTS
ncbi:universal stress protein A-like protein [Mercurialis annua]|uniref:universal stress protein A-like protein n=1 Tax=Mercurialis annua TaxID=3986 RepID=UPI0021609A7B|nr:universal stress protein A-like protein [Mercurialis annua]